MALIEGLPPVNAALLRQYFAALSTLEQCIAFFDGETWAESHPDMPVNQVVFHTLFFADLYLNHGDEDFRKQQFHRENPGFFQDYEELEDQVQTNFYDRDTCRTYLEHCRAKADATLRGESAEILAGDCGYPRRGLSRVELHVYNVRHVQHHAAQLGLRNQLRGGTALRWVSKG
jgi:hypothetical protein